MVVLALMVGEVEGSLIEIERIQCEVSTACSKESVVSSTLRRENQLREMERQLGSAFKLPVWENPL